MQATAPWQRWRTDRWPTGDVTNLERRDGPEVLPRPSWICANFAKHMRLNGNGFDRGRPDESDDEYRARIKLEAGQTPGER